MTNPPPAQGTGLGMASQAAIIIAWILGALAATARVETGLAAAILGLVGLVLAATAFFRARPGLGAFGFAAGWAQVGSLVFALIVFLVIPGDREWGKLAAMVFAAGALGVGTVGAHLVAGLGLRRAGLGVVGWVAAAAFIGALALCLLAVATSAEVLIGALAFAFVGHTALLVGFLVLGRSSR